MVCALKSHAWLLYVTLRERREVKLSKRIFKLVRELVLCYADHTLTHTNFNLQVPGAGESAFYSGDDTYPS